MAPHHGRWPKPSAPLRGKNEISSPDVLDRLVRTVTHRDESSLDEALGIVAHHREVAVPDRRRVGRARRIRLAAGRSRRVDQQLEQPVLDLELL